MAATKLPHDIDATTARSDKITTPACFSYPLPGSRKLVEHRVQLAVIQDDVW